MKFFQFQNYTCKLGQNSLENWSLLDQSNKDDIFFHLSSFPSGYVILNHDTVLTDEMIQTAAKICKDNTKFKNINNIKVDYCSVNNLIKGNIEGEVYFKSNRKVSKIKLHK